MAIARCTNRITKSPHYAKILREYNERFARDGKVNSVKFYNEIIKELVPNYSLQAWYQYLARYKNAAGALVELANIRTQPPANPNIEENNLQNNVLTAAQASHTALQKALNIGLKRLQELETDPSKLSFKDAVDLIFKSMKAQDSRARVIKEVREDAREEEKFNRMLNEDIYNG